MEEEEEQEDGEPKERDSDMLIAEEGAVDLTARLSSAICFWPRSLSQLFFFSFVFLVTSYGPGFSFLLPFLSLPPFSSLWPLLKVLT